MPNNCLALGHAAEHLVCADLLLRGYNAYLSTQNCAYDVVVDLNGVLIRIQVKSTQKPTKNPSPRSKHPYVYVWHVRRTGKKNRRKYSGTEFDILALVALDSRQIAYMPPENQKTIVCIKPDNLIGNGKIFENFQIEEVIYNCI